AASPLLGAPTLVVHDLAGTTGPGKSDGRVGNVVFIDSATVGRDLAVNTGAGNGHSTGNRIRISSPPVGRDLAVAAGAGNGGIDGNLIDIISGSVGHDLAVTTGAGTGPISLGN